MIVRTTLTIDDTTAKKLKQIAHETGKSYKQVVNETLRRGLSATEVREKAAPYKLKTVSLGDAAPGYNLDKALAIADSLEDEEIVGKLHLRK
jgi:predicted transcriptional regulator